MTDTGVPPAGSGYSAEPEPSCTVSAVPVSIPNALTAAARALLLNVYRGKTSSIPSDGIGEFHHADGDWRRSGESSELGQAWIDLCKAGLIGNYDCFAGCNYCHITEQGERVAEQLIAAAVRHGDAQ